MARRALLVGINDYKGVTDLRGCVNDVTNIRNVLKTYLGFTNNDIRVLVDSRATKNEIMLRLKYMVDKAKPGDFMVFHFSGHGSQIRDRNKDELEDQMDELLCPYDMNWDGTFILDDDLDALFKRIPDGALLEVILDCCHSGTATRDLAPAPCPSESPVQPAYQKARFLEPPEDIRCRYEGDEDQLGEIRGFRSLNRSGSRSTGRHILWSGCTSSQTSADASINGTFNGAFSYYFCKHMRDTGGALSRTNLLSRIRNSLRYGGYTQVPQIECGSQNYCNGYPLQFPAPDQGGRRSLYLTTPYIVGDDVRDVQEALQKSGFRINPDGVFGPHTREVVKRFQREKGLPEDGMVSPPLLSALFKE